MGQGLRVRGVRRLARVARVVRVVRFRLGPEVTVMGASVVLAAAWAFAAFAAWSHVAMHRRLEARIALLEREAELSLATIEALAEKLARVSS